MHHVPTQSDKTPPGPSVSLTPRLLSRRQTATALGISVWTLDDLVRAGKLAAKKLGARVMFDPAEIDRFAEELPAWEPK